MEKLENSTNPVTKPTIISKTQPSEWEKWLYNNPRYQTDKKLNKMVGSIYYKLISEGYDGESRRFFLELDRRLNQYYQNQNNNYSEYRQNSNNTYRSKNNTPSVSLDLSHETDSFTRPSSTTNKEECTYKSVMTKADMKACGINY